MGAAASEPAGLLPPRPGPEGVAVCRPPSHRCRRNTGCPRWPRKGAECFWGDGKGYVCVVGGGLGGGLGGPALRLAGAGGAAGGAACAFPGVLLLVPSVVGEVVPGAWGAAKGESGVSGGGDRGGSMPQHAAVPQQGTLWLHREPR